MESPKEAPPAFSSLSLSSTSSTSSNNNNNNNALAFKLCFKDDIRRLTVQQGESLLTFASLMASASEFSSLVGFKLTWKDDEGDLITMRSQLDLDEALTFLSASGSSSLKVFIEEIQAPPYSAVERVERVASEEDDDDEEEEEEDGDETDDEDRSNESDDEKEDFEDELQDIVGLADDLESGKSENDLVAPKLRKRLEKFDAKLGKKSSKWISKTEKLKRSPHFNEAEFTRQIQVLKDAAIPVYPYICLLLAKRLVWMNKKIAKNEKKLARHPHRHGNGSSNVVADIVDGRNGYIPHEKKLAKMLEITRKQLEYLRERQMPTGWPIVTYLEFQNKQGLVAKDELIHQQLGHLRYLKNLPEPMVVCILKAFNDRRRR